MSRNLEMHGGFGSDACIYPLVGEQVNTNIVPKTTVLTTASPFEFLFPPLFLAFEISAPSNVMIP